jgi:hypothetical protein
VRSKLFDESSMSTECTCQIFRFLRPFNFRDDGLSLALLFWLSILILDESTEHGEIVFWLVVA